MAHGTIGNDKVRLVFDEPGAHPVMSVLVEGSDGDWFPVAILGARQLRYFHKGASFPRLIVGGNEQETGPGVDIDATGGGTAVVIRDVRGGFDIESRIVLEPSSPIVHVTHKLTPAAPGGGTAAREGGEIERLLQPTGVNRVFDRFDFIYAQGEDGGLDYCSVPHLRPKSDMVISDQVFRSPAVMMRKDDVFFAVIPDLDMLEEGYGAGCIRYYLDLVVSGGENHCPALNFGIGRSHVKGHVYFENDFQKEFECGPGQSLLLGYYLIADRDGIGPSDVVSFIWEKFGRQRYLSGEPQTAGWDRFASQGLARIFKRSDIFKTFNLEGQTCGGSIGIHFLNRRGVRLMGLRELQRYLRYQDVILAVSRFGIEQMSERPWLESLFEKAQFRYGPKVPPQVFMQSWFNNLRSAYGAYWFARRWNDHELLEHSLAVKNLAIQAPRENGAFPAVCYPTDAGIFWSRGTRGFKHLDWYHTPDCATTGYYMANWFKDHEGDPRLLARCRELAEFFLDLQLPSGAFPTWVQPGGGKMRVLDELKESASTAAPAMFLARLFHIESDVRYLQSAMLACDFLSREVIPQQKWFDYETFFSCSKKRMGLFDENTGSYAQNTMSMYWTAELMRQVYLATLDDDYLRAGTEVLDRLCLYQQVWDPPFLSIDAFGGFGSMNTDAEWNDARQALMATLLMDYYGVTGKADHMERGISALRASFTTMFIEENNRVAPGNMRSAIPEETGSVAENYAHFGHDHAIPGFLDSDWGAGSACHAAAYAQMHYGDIFVDASRMRAFGINGCSVKRLAEVDGKLELDVDFHVDPVVDVLVRISGAAPARGVEVNGRQARRTAAGEYCVHL